MADQNIMNLTVKTEPDASSDYILGLDTAEGYIITYENFQAAILSKLASSFSSDGDGNITLNV